jgi:hypothetical protein
MLKKGTQADKISALSVLVERNPQAGICFLMQLLGNAKKPNRKAAESAIFALKDLFT